ncbi:MAG: flavodoxin family protein [Chloroflexota bacterium]
MKVLGIVCSPRRGGNTEIMMETALAGARRSGAETELWSTAGKDLKPCDSCFTCRKKGVACHIQDDMQELYPKILAADGLIFGSPSYFMSVTAQAKIVIDRLFSLYNQYVLANKVAGVVAVADARGQEGVWRQFSQFFSFCHMFPADYAFGFAREKGDVRKDRCAMKSSEELGKQIVSLIKQQLRWPEEYRRPIYRIMREDYGLDTCPMHYAPPQT